MRVPSIQVESAGLGGNPTALAGPLGDVERGPGGDRAPLVHPDKRSQLLGISRYLLIELPK